MDKHLAFKFTCTNNSDRYVLVGNCSTYISDHATYEDAAKARDEDSRKGKYQYDFAYVDIVSPNETVTTRDLTQSLPVPYDPDIDWDISAN